MPDARNTVQFSRIQRYQAPVPSELTRKTLQGPLLLVLNLHSTFISAMTNENPYINKPPVQSTLAKTPTKEFIPPSPLDNDTVEDLTRDLEHVLHPAALFRDESSGDEPLADFLCRKITAQQVERAMVSLLDHVLR